MLHFTARSPKVTDGILLIAGCASGDGSCQARTEQDRSRFVFPQQVWDDLYGAVWRADLHGERWYQKLIQIGYITREEPTDGKRTRTLRPSRAMPRRSR